MHLTPGAVGRRAATQQPRASGQAAVAEAEARDAREALGPYPFKEIEEKWQSYWEANKTFRTPEKASNLHGGSGNRLASASLTATHALCRLLIFMFALYFI